jgi:hypothetical protein
MQLPVSLPWSWHDVMLAWLIPPSRDEPSSPLSPLWENVRSELDPNKRCNKFNREITTLFYQ